MKYDFTLQDTNEDNFHKSVMIMNNHLRGRFIYHSGLIHNTKAQKDADALIKEWAIEGYWPVKEDDEPAWCSDLTRQYHT